MEKIPASPPKLGEAERKVFSVFLKLIEEKDINRITVTEVCKKAEINRSSFYRYFYDIYDLEEKAEMYFIESLVAFWSTHNFGISPENESFEFIKDGVYGFEGGLISIVLNVLKLDNAIAKRMFERFTDVIPQFFDEKLQQNDEMMTALKFILNGSIYYIINMGGNFDYYTMLQVVQITSHILNSFADTIKQSGKIAAPVTKSDSFDVPKKKSERLSVMKTKRSLQNAFLEMRRKRTFDKITVSELCEKAEVSHSTFYNHYNSLEAFADSIKNDAIENSLNIGLKILGSMDAGTIDVSDLSAFISITQKRILSLFGDTNEFTSFPKEFTDRFFKYIDPIYDCKFDKRIVFDFVCSCAFFSLFQPCDGKALSLEEAFNLAYTAVTMTYTRKEDIE